MLKKKKHDDPIDLTDPWYKNEALVSGILFFVLIAIGVLVLALL
jgi:hypothetical protein